jgi:hypothetical protein
MNATLTPAEERAQWLVVAASLREREQEARRAGKWGKARQHDLDAREAEAKAAACEEAAASEGN